MQAAKPLDPRWVVALLIGIGGLPLIAVGFVTGLQWRQFNGAELMQFDRPWNWVVGGLYIALGVAFLAVAIDHFVRAPRGPNGNRDPGSRVRRLTPEGTPAASIRLRLLSFHEGFPAEFKVFVDARQVDELVDGEVHEFLVSPGDHRIHVEWHRHRSLPLDVSLRDNETADFECDRAPKISKNVWGIRAIKACCCGFMLALGSIKVAFAWTIFVAVAGFSIMGWLLVREFTAPSTDLILRPVSEE